MTDTVNTSTAPKGTAFRLERYGRAWHVTEGRATGSYFGHDVTTFARWVDAVEYLGRRGFDTTALVAPGSEQVAPAPKRPTCRGCGATFNGERGLRSHQSRRFVSLACKPVTA